MSVNVKEDLCSDIECLTSIDPLAGKEGVSPIALQVATMMRDHLRSIQASGVLPQLSLELPAVPQLQLDSNVGAPRSSSAGLQPSATGQQIAVINSCPLLVVPSTMPLPPEPSLYRPVRPSRSISAPSEPGQRPTQPIRCISAPSRLPAEHQPLRPGNVISSGVPQAHPRYRETGRLAPSPVTKPSPPPKAEVKVRVVHAPARAGQDIKPEVENVRSILSSPAAVSSGEQPGRSGQQGRELSHPSPPTHSTSPQPDSSSPAVQNGTVKAKRLAGPSLSADSTPFALQESSKPGEDKARSRCAFCPVTTLRGTSTGSCLP